MFGYQHVQHIILKLPGPLYSVSVLYICFIFNIVFQL